MTFVSLRGVMVAALAAIVVLVAWAIAKRSRLVDSNIEIDDLLLGEDGRISKAAVVMLGAFSLTSWGMVYMWLNKTMSEAYFMAYLGAWVAPTVTALIVRKTKQAKK